MKKVLYTLGVLTLAVSAFSVTAQASPNGVVSLAATEISYGSQAVPLHSTKEVVTYNGFGKVVETTRKTKKGNVVQVVQNDREGNKVSTTKYLNQQGHVVKRVVKKFAQVASVHHHKSYTVKRGDTLNKIADRFHTTVARLMHINKLYSTTIYIGQKIKA